MATTRGGENAAAALGAVAARAAAEPGRAIDHFAAWAEVAGLRPYPHQRSALDALAAGRHVVLGTPTGSGKSLVALGLHVLALAGARRSFYTSPTKALTNEKFFQWCGLFGSDAVGLMTGDATVNPGAPIICCTTEILALMALREAPEALPRDVVLDEFHFFADPERGWAWQVPLVLMPPGTTFLVMSATLGDPEAVAGHLRRRGDRPVEVVVSEHRPVPLDYSYRETPIHRTVQDLVAAREVPAYIVSFTHRACAELAGGLVSLNLVDRDERRRLRDALAGADFDTPYGKEMRRLLSAGVGIHHAGLLPKYRLLVERLAQAGLLKVICGTDTLGVGVNIPIRTVVFSALAKYDGERVRALSARDFRQIAGRAGRKGFDEHGSVVAQAPEHVVEERRRQERAARSGGPAAPGGPGGRSGRGGWGGRGGRGGGGGRSGGGAGGGRRGRRQGQWRGGRSAGGPTGGPPAGGPLAGGGGRRPPRGTVTWDRRTFERLIESPPAPLSARFRVNHGMLIQVLQRAAAPTGYACLVDLILRADVPESARPRLLREAAVLFRALARAGIVAVARDPATGRPVVRVSAELQRDFSLHETLSLYLVEAVAALDPTAPEHAWHVLSLAEAIVEDTPFILAQQARRARGERLARLKAEGVPYDERVAELEAVTHPRPFTEFILPTFAAFAARHPWVRAADIHPKSVARDMLERGLDFSGYVRLYGLERGEGLLLRHLSQVYKVMVQTVPEPARTPAVGALTARLRAELVAVDASLVEAWERLVEGDGVVGGRRG